MNARGWLVLWLSFQFVQRVASSTQCQSTTYTTGASQRGASCPSPSGSFSVTTCSRETDRVLGWSASNVGSYITYFTIRCCPAGAKLLEVQPDKQALLNSACDFVSINSGNTGTSGSGQDSVLSNKGNTDPTQPYWGYYGINFGVDSTSHITYVGFLNLDNAPEVLWKVAPEQNTKDHYTYTCPTGTSIVGIYYHFIEKRFSQPFGIQCMPRLCAPGQYSVNWGKSCSACPIGYFSSSSHTTTCSRCTGGVPLVIGFLDLDYAALTFTSAGTDTNNCQYTCNPGYGGGSAGSTCSTGCCKCKAGYHSPTGGACVACPPGTFSSDVGAITCTVCQNGVTFQTAAAATTCQPCLSLSLMPGKYQIACTVTTNTVNVACPACPGGKYLSPSCGGTQQPACVNCEAGKIQANTITEGWDKAAHVCSLCGAGTYQSGVGMSRCTNCINAQPANGAYAEWSGPSVDGANCPRRCNPGFGFNGSQCVQCSLGSYSPGALTPAACLSCIGLSTNAYWLQPVQFNRSWNGCPRDCRVGFFRNLQTGNCVSCANGKTYSDTARTTDSQLPNACRNCSVCESGKYSSRVCNTSSNTVCTSCINICAPGQFVRLCNSTHASTCIPCKRSCSTGQYMTDLCTGTAFLDTVQCVTCRTPSACMTGLYMPAGQCPGNTTRNSECVVCQSLPCPFGSYQRVCSMFNDTSCVNYTQCLPGRTTLRNRGLTHDGVCLNCTNCSAFRRGTVSNCSQYHDTLCDGTACSGASPCVNSADQNFFCSMDAFGAARASRTTQGVCGLCPDGYSSDGLFCYECPGGKTCSRDGMVRCQGQVRLGAEPWCFGEYAQPTGDPCPYVADSTRVVTRSTFLRPNGNCAPYFTCAPGYFKHFSSIGLVTCNPCENSLMPINFAWFSDGLSLNDPFSCMFECAVRSSWPNGACSALNTISYIPKNAAGFYDDRSGVMKPCPIGSTSQAGLAISIADCVVCHAPANTLGEPCQTWTCQFGWLQRGGLCFDPGDCPPQMIGYTRVLGACVATALPWQPPGFQKAQAATPGAIPDVLVSRGDSGVALDDTVSAAVQDASNRTLVFYSTPYGRSKRHWLAVNATTNVDLPGRVCSAAAIVCQGRQYVVVAFCNASFLSFLDLSLANPSPRVLIGASASGYREGFKADARFERVLHVASEAGRSSLFVADTMNCAVRVVSIPTLPGDFVVRSYLVHGYTAVVCSTAPTAILYPGRLFPVLGQTYFLFPATGGLYQLDAGTRSVVQVLADSRTPAWVPDLSLLLSVTLAANTSVLTLGFATTTAVLTPSQQRCDVGFTSVTGGACTVSCSTSTNYVDPASGECRLCFTRACLSGEEDVPCTPTSPQTCQACLPLEPERGLYPRIYNLPGSCALSNTLYTAPCPVGFYLSATPVRGFQICASCPMFSNTSSDGSTSIDQCRCYDGAMKVAGGACVVKQIYPLPTLSKCPFGRYARGALERCSSCRLDPFPSCDFGRYPLSNGSCEACQVPQNAVPLRAGRAVNAPSSCGFACLPGYYPLSNTSYLTQCKPCTNAPNVSGSEAEYYPVTNGQQDSPSGCTWGCRYPFRILNGQCVPCTLVNPRDSGLPCRRPGWGVNSSAGIGSVGSLGAIQYRMIRFNTSGYVVFSANTTVDLLVVGGGGAGGAVLSSVFRGAGGGGGAGQVLLAYNVVMRANVTYAVTVGEGGTWASGAGTPATSSSVAGFQALYGGNGGGGLANDGARGSVGASGGGTGSSGTSSLTVGGGALAGFPGGGTTGVFMAGGGGGSGCPGETSQPCAMAALTNGNGDRSGAGGCGLVMWANASDTFFFPGSSPELAGGGGGGSGWFYCPAGNSSVGGAGGAQPAPDNSGSGGGGASAQSLTFYIQGSPIPFMPGGSGGSGVVVIRYVDEACVCRL